VSRIMVDEGKISNSQSLEHAVVWFREDLVHLHLKALCCLVSTQRSG
jgi:hypothetical protein